MSVASPLPSWFTNPGGLAAPKEDALEAFRDLMSLTDEILDAFCHRDLQTGNYGFDEDDGPSVVHLDSFIVGTGYSGGLTDLIWCGVRMDTLRSFCDKLRRAALRPMK